MLDARLAQRFTAGLRNRQNWLFSHYCRIWVRKIRCVRDGPRSRQLCWQRSDRITNLIELKDWLRRSSRSAREGSFPDTDALADGYWHMRATAPRRIQGYFSKSRSGVTCSLGFSNREEEHLAVGLWRRRELVLPNGERLRLFDYQMPLKSVRADTGVGKVDLVGRGADSRFAIIELKVAANAEDRRIALIEGLIYAAIVEANLPRIINESAEAHGVTIIPERPKIFVIAPPEYWSNTMAYPNTDEIARLANEIASVIPIEIELLHLRDADVTLGLNGQPPSVRGYAYLSALSEDGEAKTPCRPVGGVGHRDYLAALRQRFWHYRRGAFADAGELFEPRASEDQDPVVFRAGHLHRNLLVPPTARPETISAIQAMIAPADRHRHFGSMQSSQALAQSVFGSLAVLQRMDALAGLAAEDGYPAFFEGSAGYAMTLEHPISALGEPRPTSIDAFFLGPTKVAVEIKFAEETFGRCSRPALTPDKPNYTRDHCDGTFAVQRGRTARCSLSERGIGYWRFIPRIFVWSPDQDHRPCPLGLNYQLVRTVLAACVGDDGTLEIENSHALVIYDARNPAFHTGGDADAQWWATVRALRYPRLLRRVSWQSLAAHLQQFDELRWLTEGVEAKYGISSEMRFP